MAEFMPIPPEDPVEAAYRRALLDDESGREARRARLMAALPPPMATEPLAVARDVMAWRQSTWLLAALLSGLLLVAVGLLKGREGAAPAGPDPRLAAAPAAAPASEATRVAQVAQAASDVAAPGAASARVPVVVADASQARVKAARPRQAETAAVSSPAIVADAPPPAAMTRAEPGARAEAALAGAPPPAAVPPAAPAAVAAAPPALPAAERSAAAEARAESLAKLPAPTSPGLTADRAALPMAAAPAPALGEPVPTRLRLLAAAGQGDVASLRAALQSGVSVQVRDAQGRTPLMLAARAGSREAVSLLMAAGARAGDRDEQGWTAADHARDRGHDGLIELLRVP